MTPVFLLSIIHSLLVYLTLIALEGEALPVSTATDTLRLVHVVFRHGDRNPELSGVWPGNFYSDAEFYPEGFGQLTNKGKVVEYELGQILRIRYDAFLGNIWNSDIQELRSTAVTRAQISGLLVMAGLWPPTGSNIWNQQLPWIPVPYIYEDTSKDRTQNVMSSPEITNYIDGKYGETRQIIKENTGIKDDPSGLITFLYGDTMRVQQQLGLPLDEWTLKIFPEPLNSLSVDMYSIITNTTKQRQIIAGNLVNKILTDSRSLINGTLSPATRKLFAYSCHDFNVGGLLRSLDAYKLKFVPPYGSAVILELHEIDGVYGLKLFYLDYTEGSPHLLTIPGCAHFCPIDQFANLVSDIIPKEKYAC